MTNGKKSCLAKLLIVDDEPSVRYSLSCVLTEIGYDVRSAEDGFQALLEIRNEIPEILLSDLHMPGMSGFELLSEVRQRFPAIQTIAMSGAFRGDEVPSGVAADGFYQKGSSMGSLLRIMSDLPRRDRLSRNQPDREPVPFLQSAIREPIAASLPQPAC
jgi:CheY-like chemotaxis protein